MKSLSEFVMDSIVIKDLFVDAVHINSIDEADNILHNINCGINNKVIFKNSSIKSYFIDKLSTIRPDINVINCNCSVDKFNENSFNGFLVFDNVNRCKYYDIISEIKKYNGVILC